MLISASVRVSHCIFGIAVADTRSSATQSLQTLRVFTPTSAASVAKGFCVSESLFVQPPSPQPSSDESNKAIKPLRFFASFSLFFFQKEKEKYNKFKSRRLLFLSFFPKAFKVKAFSQSFRKAQPFVYSL